MGRRSSSSASYSPRGIMARKGKGIDVVLELRLGSIVKRWRRVKGVLWYNQDIKDHEKSHPDCD